MLRPRKKYTVFDLQQLKGKRCLTHIHVKSPEEAAAADAAGIDLMSCSFDSPEAQARLPLLVAAAPGAFFSGSTPHGMASPEEADTRASPNQVPYLKASSQRSNF
jgi:3-methyl-2-oxobutanoate hydroxymethyltransferase